MGTNTCEKAFRCTLELWSIYKVIWTNKTTYTHEIGRQSNPTVRHLVEILTAC